MVKITVVGSINMDLVVRAERFPGPGETVHGQEFRTIYGGKGANQAVAAARQGAEVTMVGRVGSDTFGQELLAALSRDRVDTGHLLVDPESASGIASIAIDGQGENRIIVVAGANGRISTDDLDRARNMLAGADIMILQLEIPLEVVSHAMRLGEGAPKIILNAAPAPSGQFSSELLEQIDYLVVNEHEAAVIAGLGTHNGDALAAARTLVRMGAARVIITLGERGALVADGQEITSVAGFRVEVRDTTGAGDAFVGTLAVALGAGRSLLEAVRWANASGALATTTLGAQPSLPTYAQVAAFLADRLEAGPSKKWLGREG